MSSLFEDYAIIARSGLFDAAYYLSTNPDVAALNYDPLLHYLEQGARELRNPNPEFDAQSYMSQCWEQGQDPENPLLHYITVQAAQPRQQLEAEAETDIRIGLDRAYVGGGSAGTERRITGEGWIVARQQVTEVSIAIGQIGTAARYGMTRTDVAQAFPQYPKSEQSGFAFTLAGIRPEDAEGSVEIAFAIKTADGRTHGGVMQANLEQAPEQAGAAPRDQPAAEPTYRGLPPLKLEVDSGSVDKQGVLHLSGWAVCFAPILTIQVFIDDKRIGAAHHGQLREDVGLAFPDYPGARNAGFSLSSDIPDIEPGRRSLKVEAISSTGIAREVVLPIDVVAQAKRTAPQQDIAINLFCDTIELSTDGWLVAEGWAICPAETAEILVELNGVGVGTAEIGRERADVGNLFPALPHARKAGFAFRKVTEPVSEGEHMIVLRVRDRNGAEDEIPLPVLARMREAAPDADAPQPDELLKLNIDIPRIVGGEMETPVRGNLEIAGWAVARLGVASIDIAVDGEFLTSVYTGVRRLDVYSQFGDWPGALTSGFTALISHRSLPVGRHRLSATLRDDAKNWMRLEFSIEVEKAPETIGPWSLRERMPLAEAELDRRILAKLDWNPRFWVALAVSAKDEPIRLARRTLSSLAAQAYPNLRILVLPRGKAVEHDRFATQLLEGFSRLADRVEIVKRADTTLADVIGEKDARPVYFMALRPGDELGCDGLVELAVESGMRRDADFIYADDRRISPITGAVEAFFKPDWSPDLLLSTNYIGRAWCASDRLIERLGMPLNEMLEANPYDLVLRLTETATMIRHVPAVLLQDIHAPRIEAKAEQAALKDALTRRGIDGEVEEGVAPGIFRVRRNVTVKGLVSIIIPTMAARGLIKVCLDTLREMTTYRNFEIVCIENIPEDRQDWKTWLRANADVVLETHEPFNWSRFNNLAVARSRGEFLLFLNDDIEILRGDWLEALLEHAQRPEVGIVGPQLLYPDGRVQHAGMFLAGMGIARHAFRYMAADDPGYFGLARTQRDVIAVTGACLLTRREAFEALGRFDEVHTVVNNDLDYCLRAWRAGLQTVYTPHTTLIHHEQASRVEMDDLYDSSAFESQWASLFVAGDPFFHGRLSKERDDYSCEWEPVQLLVPGRPVFDRDEIARILVVKLDHIGDCVTALPAVRRLKKYFPRAKVDVLSSRASKSIWALEPAVDDVIEFDFFHARSALGMVERTEEDWQVLRDRLAPNGYDLAVDLRKHMETRPVLLHTGARHLAGYDHKGRYPFLDVALEWSEDQASFRKRQHAADDLTNLIDAVVAAAEPDRGLIVPRRPPLPKTPWARKLYRKPVVCIHPAAGNDMKQWPADYFALLINQLLESENVNIVLVGGPDDAPIATAILDNVQDSDAVLSLVGKLKLTDLPDFIATCALFVGNDSGPKHIAAGLGVPTIGIHSGIVDSREWGPIGELAIGIDRDMNCSPCYRSKLEDCHRSLACLRQILPGEVYRACKRMLSLRGR